jgi:hypothetical protein
MNFVVINEVFLRIRIFNVRKQSSLVRIVMTIIYIECITMLLAKTPLHIATP